VVFFGVKDRKIDRFRPVSNVEENENGSEAGVDIATGLNWE